MTIKHFEKILFNSALIILPITFAHGVTITYDLNGGVLPDGTGSYQTETNNNEVVLDNPIRTNYTFAGWCEKTDYESDGVCDSPIGVVQENGTTYYRWVVPANLNADTDYVAMWNAVEVTCPRFSSSAGWVMVEAISNGKYDFNSNGTESLDECYYVMWTANLDNMAAVIEEMQRCVFQLRNPDMSEQEFNTTYEEPYDYNYFFDTPCDYAMVGAKWTVCRYDTSTEGYTNCGKMITACDGTGFMNIMNLEGESATSNLSSYVSEQGYNINTVNWNTIWNQDLTQMSSMSDWEVYQECQVATFTCESNTWLHVGNEQICTYATKTTDRALAIRVDANHVYYVMLTPASENDYPIHAGSNHKLKIREYNAAGTESTIYNAHDMSVVSE